jgi:hypothetical protein
MILVTVWVYIGARAVMARRSSVGVAFASTLGGKGKADESSVD